MTDIKIIAMYLPQYHCIPENDLFWGKGFTDWTTVKNAKPLFEGHQQPRVPLSGEYYDLSLEKDVVWQSQLAEKYGIYGFGVYHYWFNNEKNLLTRPAEIIRDSNDVKTHYFLAWDNASWKRSWSNVEGNDWTPLYDKKESKKGPVILVDYILGEEKDWENHYNYLLKHFMSSKYIKVNNKPVFMIYNYNDKIGEMCAFWKKMAIKDGFNGIYFIMKIKDNLTIPSQFYGFKYEPIHSGWRKPSLVRRIDNKIRRIIHVSQRLSIYEYDKIWNNILTTARENKSPLIYHGAFVSYDDTPRRGLKGTMVKGDSPAKFKKYLSDLIDITKKQGKEFIFLTAWNEWGEGAYLEPDSICKFEYLEALKVL